MATATNPTPTSALRGTTNTDSLGSPRRSSAAARVVSSPWTQIVRRGESESVIAVTTSPPPPLSPSAGEQIVNDSSTSKAVEEDFDAVGVEFENPDNGSNAVGKKPAWNKPSNGGAVEVVSPVMGAVSWPPLSESTNKASPKSSDLPKTAFSDGSISISQGAGVAQKQVNTNNANANLTPNYIGPTRQRSMKRGGGGGGNPSNNNASANGGFSQPQQPLQGPVVEVVPNNSRDNSHRDGGQRGGYGSHSVGGGNDHQQQLRNSYRRGNGGQHPRGDGSYHHRYGGGRGDQERGNQDWNYHRSFGSRDAHMQHQRVPARPFIRGPPHAPAHFMPSPMPVRPFGTPMGYADVSSPIIYVPTFPPDSLRMPMMAPMQHVFFHLPDPQLVSKIVSQIDYYFSNENLIKDTFLRKNMDEQGWVPVNLIAGFKKVMQLTDNLQLILDSVRSSTVVEVQGEKIRRRNDWMKWIMPLSVRYSTVSSPQSQQKSSPDSLAEHLQSVTFDEKMEHFAYLSRSSSADFSSSSKQSDNESAEQAVAQRGQTIPLGIPSK